MMNNLKFSHREVPQLLYFFVHFDRNISIAPFFLRISVVGFCSEAGEEPSKEADCQNGGGRGQGEFLNFANGPNGMEQCNIHVLGGT